MQVVNRFNTVVFKKKFLFWTLGMVGLVLGLYIFVIYKTKTNELEATLSVAIRTLKNSIESGDWDTAISHAKYVSGLNHIYGLSVDYGDARTALISPIGVPEFGLGTVCRNLSHSQRYHITGCIKVLSQRDILGVQLTVIGILTPFLIFMFGSKRQEMLLEQSANEEMELSNFAYELIHEIKKPILSAIERIERDDQISDALRKDISEIFERPREWIDKALRDFMATRKNSGTLKISQLDENGEFCTIGTITSIKKQYPFLTSQSGSFCIHRKLLYEYCALGSDELYFCVQNLLSNAVDASTEEKLSEISIRLTYREDADQKKYCHISVRDAGSPFTSKAIAAFKERVPYTSKGDRGSGIGLCSVRKKLDGIGGDINLMQEEGFKIITLTIPLIDPPKWMAQLDALQGEVLLLDDDSLMKERLLSNFSGRFLVSQYTDEKEFLAGANDKPESTLLVDYDFSGSTDGLTFLTLNNLVSRSILISGLIPSNREITLRARKVGVPLFSKESLI